MGTEDIKGIRLYGHNKTDTYGETIVQEFI